MKRCFYMDNYPQSLPTPAEARQLVDRLQALLASGGFKLYQWASSVPSVVNHLSKESRLDSLELCHTQEKADTPELTLGLSWHFQSDTLGYKHQPVECRVRTM